jgi:hypothetical protein
MWLREKLQLRWECDSQTFCLIYWSNLVFFVILPDIFDNRVLGLDRPTVRALQRGVYLVAVFLRCQLAQVPLERVHREPDRSTASNVVISTLPSAFCTRLSATRGVSATSRALSARQSRPMSLACAYCV